MMARMPAASIRSLRSALEIDKKNPLRLDRVYLGRLVRKIHGERARNLDTTTVEQTIGVIENSTQQVVAKMWEILLDSTADEKARVAAGKVIVDAQHKLLEAQMDAGIYERKLGKVDVSHEHHLAPELAEPIMRALRNYGIIHANIIEQPAAELAAPAVGERSVIAHQ